LIRQAYIEDAQSLHQHCYPQASLEEVAGYLAWCLRQAEKGWIARFVAEIDGQAVGNVQLTEWGTTGEIGSLVVASHYRRRGIGRLLLDHTIAEAWRRQLSRVEIYVRADQRGLQNLYQELGFRLVEETKKRLSRPPSTEPVVLLRME
jgi:ribosomal protein S18 acetylase RimI-like enzyme